MQQQKRAASNSSREQQQQQRAAAAIAAAVVNPTYMYYPPVHPYVLSNVHPACISRMYLPYLKCISVNISYLSRMISQYRARHSYKKSLQSCTPTQSDSSTSKGASPHSNLRSHPPKHAYALPHSSPSTPSITSSSSPQPFKKRSTTTKQQLLSTTPTPPHQALTRQHHPKKNTTSPLSPTRRLWDHPPLRGTVTTFSTTAQNESSQSTPRRESGVRCVGSH